jgi:hypothetical protein
MPAAEPARGRDEVLLVEGARALNPFQLTGQRLESKQETLRVGRMRAAQGGLYAAAAIGENF